ncbi:hypothetical protein ACLIA0_06500 [Bacillaceae bacterium W0354]
MDQQADLIAQLMKMVAATNERLNELEWMIASDTKGNNEILNPTLPQTENMNV